MLVFVAANLLSFSFAIADEQPPFLVDGSAADHVRPQLHIPGPNSRSQKGRDREVAVSGLQVAEADKPVMDPHKVKPSPAQNEIERAWKKVQPIVKDTMHGWENVKQSLARVELKLKTFEKILEGSEGAGVGQSASRAETDRIRNEMLPLLEDARRDWESVQQTLTDMKSKWEDMLQIMRDDTQTWDATLRRLAEVQRYEADAQKLLAASEDERVTEHQKRLTAEAEVKQLTAAAEKVRNQLAEVLRYEADAQKLLAASEDERVAEHQKRLTAEADVKQLTAAAEKVRNQLAEAERKGAEAQHLLAAFQKRGKEKTELAGAGNRRSATKIEDKTTAAQIAETASVDAAKQRTVLAKLAKEPKGEDVAGGCKLPEVQTVPLPGGRMKVKVGSACYGGRPVRFRYGGAEFVRKLDRHGSLDFILDAFAGTNSPLELVFADSRIYKADVVVGDEGQFSKAAIIWRAPVNLDLHAFEYTTKPNGTGHVWANSPASLEAARSRAARTERGGGFMSSTSNGTDDGPQIEVYTFLHNDEQTSGVVALALDYETRGDKPSGDSCGDGVYGKIDYEALVLSRHGRVRREKGIVASMPCDAVLDQSMRYMRSALGDLRITR